MYVHVYVHVRILHSVSVIPYEPASHSHLSNLISKLNFHLTLSKAPTYIHTYNTECMYLLK